ncbi:MAG: hypothetical protein AB7P76_09855 [Candidatus Melainabacteria bacterium]
MPDQPDPLDKADDFAYPALPSASRPGRRAGTRGIAWHQLMFICSLDVWLAVDDITDCRIEPHDDLIDEAAWLDVADCHRFQRQLFYWLLLRRYGTAEQVMDTYTQRE